MPRARRHDVRVPGVIMADGQVQPACGSGSMQMTRGGGLARPRSVTRRTGSTLRARGPSGHLRTSEAARPDYWQGASFSDICLVQPGLIMLLPGIALKNLHAALSPRSFQ